MAIRNLYNFALRVIPRPYLIRASYVFKVFSPLFFRGNNVECPICESHFSKFLPYGVQLKRDNALCPKCLSLERHRLLWLFLQQKTDFFTAPKKVLHVAPEQCFVERFRKQKNLNYTTADLVSPLADVKMDIQKIPFEDNSFDVVICNHVLEHIDDDRLAMREIYRVLRKDGFAILQVPMDTHRTKTLEDPAIQTDADREKFYWQKDHVRLYGLDYAERLRSVGFLIEGKNFTEQIPASSKKRLCLPEKEFMFACRK